MEEKIIWNLFNSETYFKRIISYLEPSYFSEYDGLFKKISEYVSKYKSNPSLDDFDFFINNDNTLDEKSFKALQEKLNSIKSLSFQLNQESFLLESEKFVKDMALRNAILESAEIIEKNQSKEAIPSIIQKAFMKDITSDLGHDYINDMEKRLQYYQKGIVYTSMGLPTFDKMLGGGFEKKSIYVFVGKQNIGKTLLFTSLVTDLLKKGKNILYISGEMSEEKISMRVDANFLDIPINNLKNLKNSTELTPDTFRSRFMETIHKYNGKLIVKEYPTKTASTLQIENFIEELKLKQNFVPDFLVVDYLGLFKSAVVNNTTKDTYGYLQSVLEEFRAIASKLNITVVTAHQINRVGSKIKTVGDVSDTDIADSFAILFSADFSAIIFQNEEIRQNNEILFKVTKTRSDSNNNTVYKFKISYDFMRILESENPEYNESNIPLSSLEKQNFIDNPVGNFEIKKLNKKHNLSSDIVF